MLHFLIFDGIYIQGGAKVGLQFMQKIIQELINNNTRIKSVLCTYNYKPTFASLCICILPLLQKMAQEEIKSAYPWEVCEEEQGDF